MKILFLLDLYKKNYPERMTGIMVFTSETNAMRTIEHLPFDPCINVVINKQFFYTV